MDGNEDSGSLDQPWARTLPARLFREAVICGVLGTCMDAYTRRQINGHEHLRDLDQPVIFVANHASHMDTPALLRALPGRWRRRTAVAAAADYFYVKRLLAHTVSLVFGTVPLHRRGGSLHAGPPPHLARLLDERWSVVVFAEGTRSRDGRVGRLRAGSAVIAAEYGVPIVPVHVAGTHEAMPTGRRWMTRAPGRFLGRRRPIEISFGPPIVPQPGEDHRHVMERVRLFLASAGADTTPDPRVEQLRRRMELAAVAAGGADSGDAGAPTRQAV
ncbi:1-acyl-sn-glycerol-3-phosphate acyltransferase [Paraconexibacter antarcticus]|uniref:1-acyl-sn-glycerol-3-phosphate acyltransferase n=1 Tax=Paraconexibacter antarcticus TaxID=2949664 RepID=A0ABY5DQ08_9ACTN|nr:lysophospholipid acyltransferase family protein [Paraconexibacter antarcticus]UTI62971.1 1-acyl-sn-glycerol-3-phosphate acyltransferase [Paraconexibacter antarcticus]